MLPGIRAVIAAFVAATALLAAAFAVVATFQVARDDRGAVIRADLVQRVAFTPTVSGPILIVDLPRGRVMPVVEMPEPQPVPAPAPPAQTVAALPEPEPAPAIEVKPEPAIALASAEPAPVVIAAEPPVGGPLPEDARGPSPAARKAALEKAALEKARAAAIAKRKAREQRLARERRIAAARKAAQARRTATPQSSFGGSFTGSFSNTETTGSINRTGSSTTGNGSF